MRRAVSTICSLVCLLMLVGGPAEAGLFHHRKKAPKAAYGMSKAKQRKQAAKARTKVQKQRSRAIKKAPTVRASQSQG